MEVSMEFRKRQMELRKSQMSLILELMQGNTINEIAVNLNSTYSSILCMIYAKAKSMTVEQQKQILKIMQTFE